MNSEVYSFSIDYEKDVEIVRSYDLKREMSEYNREHNADKATRRVKQRFDGKLSITRSLHFRRFMIRIWLHWRGYSAGQGKPPAGNFSVIPAGVLSRVVDTPIRGRPRFQGVSLLLRRLNSFLILGHKNGNMYSRQKVVHFRAISAYL